MTDGGGQHGGGRSQAWYAAAAGLLDDQERLFARLDTLSLRQSGLIAAGDAETLLAVLVERQPVVEAIAAGTAKLAEARQNWESQNADPALRAVLRERMRRISAVAAAIAARDRKDEDEMRRASEGFAAELRSMGQQRKAQAAYGPASGSGARLQDREG